MIHSKDLVGYRPIEQASFTTRETIAIGLVSVSLMIAISAIVTGAFLTAQTGSLAGRIALGTVGTMSMTISGIAAAVCYEDYLIKKGREYRMTNMHEDSIVTQTGQPRRLSSQVDM